MVSSAVMIPERRRRDGGNVSAPAVTQLPLRLPRAQVSSDAATQAPRDSFQSER
jgi:hypothetical protein